MHACQMVSKKVVCACVPLFGVLISSGGMKQSDVGNVILYYMNAIHKTSANAHMRDFSISIFPTCGVPTYLHYVYIDDI